MINNDFTVHGYYIFILYMCLGVIDFASFHDFKILDIGTFGTV